jgi:hypothetical protein
MKISELLLEKTLRLTDDTGETFIVTHNPSYQQFHKMIGLDAPDKNGYEPEFKALLTDNDIWIWSAWHAHHYQIAKVLGLSETEHLKCLFMYKNGVVVNSQDFERFKNNPILMRLYGANFTVSFT